MKNIYDVLMGQGLLKRPILCRKKMVRLSLRFIPKANKIEIKAAVEKMFNVKVKDVTTANMHGKQKRVGKTIGTTNDWKKAYVTLSEGAINFADEL